MNSDTLVLNFIANTCTQAYPRIRICAQTLTSVEQSVLFLLYNQWPLIKGEHEMQGFGCGLLFCLRKTTDRSIGLFSMFCFQPNTEYDFICLRTTIASQHVLLTMYKRNHFPLLIHRWWGSLPPASCRVYWGRHTGETYISSVWTVAVTDWHILFVWLVWIRNYP